MVLRGTEALQVWSKRICSGYPGVRVVNMTSSFKDGLAFCAIIHRFRPDLLDFYSLNPRNVEENCRLAFHIGESELGIPALLDPVDMATCSSPDRRSVLLYLSELYNKLGNLTSEAGNRKLSLQTDQLETVGGVSETPKPKLSKSCSGTLATRDLPGVVQSPCSPVRLRAKSAKRQNSVDSGFETNLSSSIDSSSSSQTSPRESPSFQSSTPNPSHVEENLSRLFVESKEAETTPSKPGTGGEKSFSGARPEKKQFARSTQGIYPGGSLISSTSLSTSSFSLFSNSEFNVYSSPLRTYPHQPGGGRRDEMRKLYRSEGRLNSLRDFALNDTPSVVNQPVEQTVLETKQDLGRDRKEESTFKSALNKFRQSESQLNFAKPRRQSAKPGKVECKTTQTEERLLAVAQPGPDKPSQPQKMFFKQSWLGWVPRRHDSVVKPLNLIQAHYVVRDQHLNPTHPTARDLNLNSPLSRDLNLKSSLSRDLNLKSPASRDLNLNSPASRNLSLISPTSGDLNLNSPASRDLNSRKTNPVVSTVAEVHNCNPGPVKRSVRRTNFENRTYRHSYHSANLSSDYSNFFDSYEGQSTLV